MIWLAVALGGALGAVMRHAVTLSVAALQPGPFPWATLLVNVIGSLAAGLGYTLLAERLAANEPLRGLLMVGFLGALTTFSTFSIETVRLAQQGMTGLAVANSAANVLLCVLGCYLGVLLARQFI